MASKRAFSSPSPPPDFSSPLKKPKLNDSVPTTELEPMLITTESAPVLDRGNKFIAHAQSGISSLPEARAFQTHVRKLYKAYPASHYMLGWRCLTLKPGRDGLGGPDDFELRTGSDDDGEKWAGGHILKAMERANVVDCAVVVSRWFPGKMIGPDRFTHIATVCDEALLKLSQAEKINELVKQLEEKDDKIDDLLIRLGQEIAKLPNYSDLTVERAHRLCVARDKRIDLLTKKLGQKEHPGTESTGASKTDAEPQA